MKPRNQLHTLTSFILPFALIAAIWTRYDANNHSNPMRQRVQLGLPGQFTDLTIAVELMRAPEDIRKTFGGTEPVAIAQSKGDRDRVNSSVSRDYFLVAGYTLLMILLGLRTWQPGFPCPSAMRRLLVILPVFIGLFDVLENIGIQRTLKHYPEVMAGTTFFTGATSLIKWILAFCEMGLLGFSMIGLDRERKAGAFLREFSGLILMSAGFVGLFGAVFPAIIPNTFIFGFSAVLPIGLMLFIRDHWWDVRCRLNELRSSPS